MAGKASAFGLTVSEFKVWLKFSEWTFDELTCFVGECEHGPFTAIERSQNTFIQDI